MTVYRILISLFVSIALIQANRIGDSEREKLNNGQILNANKDKQRKSDIRKKIDINEKLSLRRKNQVTHKCGLNCNSNPQCQGGDRACEWCGKFDPLMVVVYCIFLLATPNIERMNLFFSSAPLPGTAAMRHRLLE
jgi:hypothetical protein